MGGVRTRTSLVLGLLGLALFGAFNNCDIQTPSVQNTADTSVGYTHTGAEVSCAGCHESLRPAVDSSGNLHGNGADCVACHTSTNSPQGDNNTVWAGLSGSFTHSGGIGSCTNCHSPNQPSPFNGFVHWNGNDCVLCHTPNGNNTTPQTQANVNSEFLGGFSYTHATGLTSCAQCHEVMRPAASTGHNQNMDCVSCHTPQNQITPFLLNDVTDIDTAWSANL